MTDHQDPPRWSEPGQAPAELTRLLSAARSDGATQPELVQLGSRLGPILGAAPAAPLTSARLLLIKTGLGLLVVSGLVTTTLLVRQSARTSASTVGSASPSTGSTAPESAPLPPAAAEAPVVLPPAQASVPASSTAAPAWHKTPSQVEGKADSAHTLDEATLLERARGELGSNPSDALALTQKHRAQFPHGVLAQEREVIAISALRRLGRTPEAEARAARFDQQYPHSAHQQSVDRPAAP